MLVAMQFTAIDPSGYHSMAIVLGVTISTGLVLVFKNVILVLHPLTWKFALSIDNCVKLTLAEMPRHRHSSDSYQNGYSSNLTGGEKYCTWVNNGRYDNNGPTTDENGYVRTSQVGGEQAHNNMPPYITVYMWVRIA